MPQLRPRKRKEPPDGDTFIYLAAIDWLRSGVPIRPELLKYIADELEWAWFKTPQERRVLRGKRQRERTARLRQLLIESVAKKDGISKTKAIEKIAERDGATVEAIKQALKPSSISGERRRKK